MKCFIIFFPFLVLIAAIPASARTDCTSIMNEKGRNSYESCIIKQEDEENSEAIEKYKKTIEEYKEDISSTYDDAIEDLTDRKDDTDDNFKRIERDMGRYIDDLKDEDADAGVIEYEEAKRSKLQKERDGTRSYFDARIEVLKKQRELLLLQADFELKKYEYTMRFHK